MNGSFILRFMFSFLFGGGGEFVDAQQLSVLNQVYYIATPRSKKKPGTRATASLSPIFISYST